LSSEAERGTRPGDERTLIRLQDGVRDRFRDLRDDGVSEGSKAVHPSGNPMSHSTHVGFKLPPTCSLNGRLLSCVPIEPDFQSRLVGVAQVVRADNASIGVPPSRVLAGAARPSLLPGVLVGDGHRASRPYLTCTLSFGSPLLFRANFRSCEAPAVGVDHRLRLTARPNSFPEGPLLRPSWLKPCGVGHDPDSVPTVRSGDLEACSPKAKLEAADAAEQTHYLHDGHSISCPMYISQDTRHSSNDGIS
jgi:hypothetical protein